ncbi:MAG: hypothetical protein ACTHX5_15055 [Brevibacterium aurantiacum]
MITHKDLIDAGAPALPEGLEYRASTRTPDSWPPREWAYVEIIRVGQTFFQRLKAGGSRITRAGVPLSSIVNPEDDGALMRGLVAQCIHAHEHYQEVLANIAAARRING